MTLDHLLYFVAGLMVGAASCLLAVLAAMRHRTSGSERAKVEVREIPERAPKYNFGDVLVSKNGFRGYVSMMFANYGAILSAGIVPGNWFDIQEFPPSTKDQVFYHLVGNGAVLAGELDVYPAMTTRAI